MAVYWLDMNYFSVRSYLCGMNLSSAPLGMLVYYSITIIFHVS
jgi:hypothetical protein